MPKACITGVGGQTGSFLADSLIENDYEVFGLKRRTSSFIRNVLIISKAISFI